MESFEEQLRKACITSGFESSWRMKEFTDEKGIPFWEISKEGETIDIL